jgi:hypothetical protein
LAKNGFTGPILASIMALTKLVVLCAPPPPWRLVADLQVTLWRRCLNENRFSGSVPPAISALTALMDLCAPHSGPPSGLG